MEAYHGQAYGRHLGDHVDDSHCLQPRDLAGQYMCDFGQLLFRSQPYAEEEAHPEENRRYDSLNRHSSHRRVSVL
jgi:hypothetical protein